MSLKKIKKIKLDIIKNKKGDILKYLNRKDKFFNKFGEIYFSEIKKNEIKGWNYHKKCFCLFAVPYGEVKFIFAKKISGKKKIIKISRKNYFIIVVPPKTWFCFRSISKISLVVNCLDKTHDPKESLKIAID